MEPNISIMERQGSCLLLRSASQNSLDESSQKHISQIHPHTKERPPYRNHLHTQKAFDVMNVMRKQSLLCDVVLVAGDAEISAHKMVLAACSPYFYAMFSSFEESRQDRIVLQEVDQQALMLLIEYVYTSEVSVTEDNVQVLLPAANLLQLTDVRDACCDFLQAQLHPTNCLGIRAFADLHGCLDLLTHAEYYIELHFSEVVECEEFLTLSHLQVSKLISSDRLTVPTEEKVFECVVAWVQNDLESRKQHLSSLMEYVRLPLMSQEYLVQRVEQEPLLKTDLQCKDYIIEALKYHLLKGDNKTSFRTPRTKPRQPVGLPKVLLVVGGQAPKAIRSVESYDFKEERWYQVAEMPTRRCRAGLAVLGSKVYAVGGFNGSLRVKTVDYYDPAMDVWTACEGMEARRSTLGVAVLNNCIYAVGGFDGSTGLNSAEMFDPQTGKWRIIASMSTRRSSVGVGVLYGQLYAVGGYDGASRQCLSSVECYTPDTDTWMSVPDMGCRRSGAGVAGTVIFRILKRTADFSVNNTENVPQFQTKPLPLPKRSKLFLEHSMRERESAIDIHQSFQKDLLKLRLDVAKTLLQYKSNENEIANFKGQLKLSAQVLGIGTKLTVIFTLENLDDTKPLNGVTMVLHVKPENYVCSRNTVLIPLLLPVSSYKVKIGIQEIIHEDQMHACKMEELGVIRIFIINDSKEQVQPLLAATVTMPLSESALV